MRHERADPGALLDEVEDGFQHLGLRLFDFAQQDATEGKRLSEFTVRLNGSPLAIYTRTYRTARAEALDYRIVFAGAAVKNWVVQVTVEYADPRDTQTEAEFLRAVYAAAERQIGAQ